MSIRRDPYYVRPRRIDYERMNREYPRQKAALTRAEKIGLEAIVTTCEKTVDAWDEIGCWPDAWARWARALEDAWWKARREDDDIPEMLGERVEALVHRGLR